MFINPLKAFRRDKTAAVNECVVGLGDGGRSTNAEKVGGGCLKMT